MAVNNFFRPALPEDMRQLAMVAGARYAMTSRDYVYLALRVALDAEGYDLGRHALNDAEREAISKMCHLRSLGEATQAPEPDPPSG